MNTTDNTKNTDKKPKKLSSHEELLEEMENLQEKLENIEYLHKWTNFWMFVLVAMVGVFGMLFLEKYDVHSGKNNADKETQDLLRKIEEHTDPNIFRHLESENFQKQAEKIEKEMQAFIRNAEKEAEKQTEQSNKLRELLEQKIITHDEYWELVWIKQIKLNTKSGAKRGEIQYFKNSQEITKEEFERWDEIKTILNQNNIEFYQ